MNLLITGAFGFVGTNIAKDLTSQLVAIDVAQPDRHIFDEYYSWNDLEKIEWEKFNAIIHLAGKAHDTKNTLADQEYFDVNVGLTKKIFQYFLGSEATKFIFFSSVKSVADSVIGKVLIEDIVPNPQTPYGRSKLEAERYILDELDKWNNGYMKAQQQDYMKKNENVRSRDGEKTRIVKKVYILRPSMIHGPGNKGNLNLLYKFSQKGLPWPLGAFENRRSFCSIDNISFVVQQLIEREIEPGTYNVADDEALSTNELISLIAKSQNKKARIWKIPQGPIKILARIGDFFSFPLNSERLKKLTESFFVSNEKIKKALGIEKMPITAEEGFRKTFESFKGRK